MSRQGWQRNMVIGIGRGSISIVEVHLPKGGHFCIRPRSSNFMSFTSRTKIFKKWSVDNVGNELYRVFTTAERAFSFQQKRAFIQ